MTNWIDVTMPISKDMAVWPGNDAPKLDRQGSFEDGDDAITSVLITDLHNGTHVDAPLHFLADGDTAEHMDLAKLIGPAVVVDATGTEIVDAQLLQDRVPVGTKRLLLRTNNSVDRGSSLTEFDTSFVALDEDAAQWIADNGIELVGIDYLSIAKYNGPPETHRNLLGTGVLVIEGLMLDTIEPGEYELMALPLLIVDGEAAPARVLLRQA